MKIRRCLLLTFATSIFLTVLLHGEYTFFTPPGSFTVEVSLENSAYLRLPIYRNAITSLEVVGDYALGGTSASPSMSPFLFAVSLSRRRLELVLDLSSVLPGQRCVQSGFGRGPEGFLYGGTIPDKPGDGGHLFKFRVKGNEIEAFDLGVPVAGQGIFALAMDSSSGRIYGISHPSGKFFIQNLQNQETKIFEETSPTKETLGFLHQYALNPADYLSRRLAIDQKGRVYGSQPVNKIFRFDPETQKIDVLEDELPEVWGRRPLGRVDAWAVAPDGKLYGGNAGDGQLFKLDPLSGKVTNLGKPVMMPRITGLTFGSDGKLYGVAGASPGYAHLFSYDPAGRGFVDLGNPRFTMTEPGLQQGIAWRGFQIGSVAASEDGRTIVLGEEESLSQLMVFSVP
jgi:hypothetical protein